MEKLDILIIGAGPSGVTAAIYAKRAGLNFLLMEKSAIGGKVVDIFELENYPELRATVPKIVESNSIYISFFDWPVSA